MNSILVDNNYCFWLKGVSRGKQMQPWWDLPSGSGCLGVFCVFALSFLYVCFECNNAMEACVNHTMPVPSGQHVFLMVKVFACFLVQLYFFFSLIWWSLESSLPVATLSSHTGMHWFWLWSSSLVETEPILSYAATEHQQASGRDEMCSSTVVRVNIKLKWNKLLSACGYVLALILTTCIHIQHNSDLLQSLFDLRYHSVWHTQCYVLIKSAFFQVNSALTQTVSVYVLLSSSFQYLFSWILIWCRCCFVFFPVKPQAKLILYHSVLNSSRVLLFIQYTKQVLKIYCSRWSINTILKLQPRFIKENVIISCFYMHSAKKNRKIH